MPASALKSMAAKSNKSLADLERYWNEAKEDVPSDAKDEYAYIMGIVKKRAGLSEETIGMFSEEEWTDFFDGLDRAYFPEKLNETYTPSTWDELMTKDPDRGTYVAYKPKLLPGYEGIQVMKWGGPDHKEKFHNTAWELIAHAEKETLLSLHGRWSLIGEFALPLSQHPGVANVPDAEGEEDEELNESVMGLVKLNPVDEESLQQAINFAKDMSGSGHGGRQYFAADNQSFFDWLRRMLAPYGNPQVVQLSSGQKIYITFDDAAYPVNILVADLNEKLVTDMYTQGDIGIKKNRPQPKSELQKKVIKLSTKLSEGFYSPEELIGIWHSKQARRVEIYKSKGPFGYVARNVEDDSLVGNWTDEKGATNFLQMNKYYKA